MMSTLNITDAPSPNFDARDAAPDLIILHYTGMASGEAALRRMQDSGPRYAAYADALPPGFPKMAPDAELGRVSAHYLVETDGRVFRLVDEGQRAWHAGVASWDGAADINARSIGVEIVNGGHDFDLPDYPNAQIESVIALVTDICARRDIPAERVIGHSDVAPDRKLDPGEHFPWMRLGDEGAAEPTPMGSGDLRRVAGPGDAGALVRGAQEGLIAIGYGLAASGAMDERTATVVAAFQRRWRQERVNGVLDAETAELIGQIADGPDV